MKKIKNVAASVHGRLQDRARQEGRPFQELVHRTRTPVALTGAFWNDPSKQSQWKAFVRRSRLVTEPTLEAVIREIELFIVPVLDRIERADVRTYTWLARGPWQPTE